MSRFIKIFLFVTIVSFVGIVWFSPLRAQDAVDTRYTEASATSSIQGFDYVPEIEEQILVDVSPENPSPNQTVNVHIESYAFDVNASKFIWSIDGVTKLQGLGKVDFSMNAGKTGQENTIRVSITAPSGRVSIREIKVRPQQVGIVYESRSYTPPFYKGRSLFTPQGHLTFLAVPNLVGDNGKVYNADELIYKWTVDGTVDGDNSGYGRKTYQFDGPVLVQDSEVDVDVSSPDGTVKGSGATLIGPTDPRLVVYENRPLLGIMFNKAVYGAYSLKTDEAQLEAFPYYFDTANKSGVNLKYSWSLNGTAVVLPDNQNSLVFRNTSGKTGQSVASVILENTNQFLQTSGANISILFGKNNTSTDVTSL